MAGIADQVGVTPGLINHYFGPKRALYATVLSEISARLPLMVRTNLGDLSTEEMIAANTQHFLDSIERDQEDWALLFGADAPRDPAIAAIVREVRTEVIERMASNHSGGDQPSDQLRLALRIFQGAAEAGAGAWRRGEADRERVERILAQTLTSLVSGVPSSPPS